METDTCESANWSLFGAERWLLSEVSFSYERMEVIRGHLCSPLSGGCPLFGGSAIGGSTVDILIIIITFPCSTCISSFFGSSLPTSLFIFLNPSSTSKDDVKVNNRIYITITENFTFT